MALTDSNHSRPLLVPSAPAAPSLARLPELHAEMSETAGLARFLRSAVAAAAGLILCWFLAVVLVSGGGLKQEFAWSLLLLAGVGAMLRSYIRSIAKGLDRAPLRESARDLRAILFYAGFAWGTGAFLLLGSDPLPIEGLCFAVLPSLLMALLLKDRAAGLNFVTPVTVLATAAIILEPWADAPVAMILLLGVQIGIAASLAVSGREPQQELPAGLSLR